MALTGSATPEHPEISSEDVHGAAVYDLKGRRLGKIDHLTIDKVSGQVRTVVLNVQGFLGLGYSHAVLPWGALKYNRKLDAYEAHAEPEPL